MNFIFDDIISELLIVWKIEHRVNHSVRVGEGSFLHDTFEFLARNPGVGRKRSDLGFPDVRSWRVTGFRRQLVEASHAHSVEYRLAVGPSLAKEELPIRSVQSEKAARWPL